jgi:hypothetical protein
MPSSGGFTYLRSGSEREGGVLEPEQELESSEAGDDYPVDGNIPAVKAWVGDDLDRAQFALDAEREDSSPRSTLIDYLESMLSVDDE